MDLNMSEVCAKRGKPYYVVMKRISRGMTMEEALETPIVRRKQDTVDRKIPSRFNRKTGLKFSELGRGEYYKQYMKMKKGGK